MSNSERILCRILDLVLIISAVVIVEGVTVGRVINEIENNHEQTREVCMRSPK